VATDARVAERMSVGTSNEFEHGGRRAATDIVGQKAIDSDNELSSVKCECSKERLYRIFNDTNNVDDELRIGAL
jgi:hypothetical protein